MSTDHKLRSTPERERNIAIALQSCASQVARGIVDALQTCVNCQHFDEGVEVCKLAGQRPPARVIAHGCPSHAPAVPF
jgi:hypothetical protein